VLHLRSLSLEPARSRDGFPFTVPALAALEELTFESPVTFLVGENGSGKSTLLEALALAAESVPVAGQALDRDESLVAVAPLARALRLTWTKRTRRGFFLRAEDFFGYARNMRRTITDLEHDAARLEDENPDLPDGELRRITAPYRGSAASLRSRYGADMNARSHGEQFLEFFKARFVPGGLYLLDEPEAPLSPSRQLAFLSLLLEGSREREAQFVIATHSPILMACPGARILSFDEVPPRSIAYDDVEHVCLTRDFLARPEAFLRHL
jgi:predicted ATPase